MTIDYAIEQGRNVKAGDLFGYFIQTFVMSTISMGATQGIGSACDLIKDKGLSELTRALAHGTFNGAMRFAQGGKFEHGFMSGFVSSLGGSFMLENAGSMSLGAKVSMSAVIGGTVEKLGGGKFANGAVTGAYVMMFNHLRAQHQKQKYSTIWDDFAVKDYASLNDNERVEHIFNAIRHTKEHGIDPEVPLDKIFTNLKTTSTLSNGGISINYAQVTIKSEIYEVMISIDLWNSTRHKNFLGTTVLFGGYGKATIDSRPGWYRSYNPGEYQIGVKGYDNYIFIMKWLGIH